MPALMDTVKGLIDAGLKEKVKIIVAAHPLHRLMPMK
jgi:hypothetical protein